MTDRCVCGRSATFPVCDGRHVEADWACAPALEPVVVVGGRHLQSVALRLAHRLGGVAVAQPEGRVGRLILLCDASDLAHLPGWLAAASARSVEVLAVDVPAAAVQRPGVVVRPVRAEDPLQLWRAVVRALEAEAAPAARPLRRAFISHAVADEAQLVPVVSSLRRHAGADLFLCADSIAPGEVWLDRILTALEAAEVFIGVLSAAAQASTFCAFEVGYATRAGKPVRLISLDGTAPPVFAGRTQAEDLARRRRAQPWLTADEALAEALLDALT